jgi:hypothetical protein
MAIKVNQSMRDDDFEIAGAEFYTHANTVEFVMTVKNQWHPAFGLTQGDCDNFTFQSGGSIDILSFSDYSGTVPNTIKATMSGSYGLTTGHPIGIVGPNVNSGGANDYHGIYELNKVSDTEFYFVNSNWNDTVAAYAYSPDRVIAGEKAAGKYVFAANASVAASANSKTIDFRLFQNYEGSIKSESRYQAKTAGEFENLPGGSFLTVAVSDMLWFAIEGITDDTNVTIRYGNIRFNRR